MLLYLNSRQYVAYEAVYISPHIATVIHGCSPYTSPSTVSIDNNGQASDRNLKFYKNKHNYQDIQYLQYSLEV